LNKRPVLEDRVVAFVDILGFREIVAGMTRSPESVAFIRDVLKVVQRQERKISRDRRIQQLRDRTHKRRGLVALVPQSRPAMTAFSDCYVLSDVVESGWRVLVAVQALAALMLYKGILLRGGVVRGKAYHRGGVVFGPGIVAAYDLEQAAKYPRVVVEDHLYRSEWFLRTKERFFVRDADGCWFVNPFLRGTSQWAGLLPELRPQQAEADFYHQVRKNIVRLLSLEMRNRRRSWERIAKLRWLAARFNDAIRAEPLAGITEIDLDSPSISRTG
jgi:hypothetical protein